VLAIAALARSFVVTLAASNPPQLAPIALHAGIVMNIPQRTLFLISNGAVIARHVRL
jgi:hypothetical protein